MRAARQNALERVVWRLLSSHDSRMCICFPSPFTTIHWRLRERRCMAMSTRAFWCTNCDEIWYWFYGLWWLESMVTRDCHCIWLPLKEDHYFEDLCLYDIHLTLDQISNIHRFHWNHQQSSSQSIKQYVHPVILSHSLSCSNLLAQLWYAWYWCTLIMTHTILGIPGLDRSTSFITIRRHQFTWILRSDTQFCIRWIIIRIP